MFMRLMCSRQAGSGAKSICGLSAPCRNSSGSKSSLELPSIDLRPEERVSSSEEMVELRKHDEAVLQRIKHQKWVSPLAVYRCMRWSFCQRWLFPFIRGLSPFTSVYICSRPPFTFDPAFTFDIFCNDYVWAGFSLSCIHCFCCLHLI